MIAFAVPVPAPPPAQIPGTALTAVTLPGAPGRVPAALDGWEARGALAPEPVTLPDGRTAVRLGGNTTLVSPAVTVPAGAQTLAVVAVSRSGALLDVGAEPVDGGDAVPLAALAPSAEGRPVPVPVAGLAGRTVRFTLDPSAAFGGTVSVVAVEPFAAPLPGWTITSGAPEVTVVSGRRSLAVRDEPVEATSPAATLGGDARFLVVAVRGSGRVRATTGGRVVAVRATSRWRDLRVPLHSGVQPRFLVLRMDPEGDTLHLRDIGLVVRGPRFAALTARARGGVVTVDGTLGVVGAGLPVTVSRGTRLLGRARALRTGRVRLRVRLRPGVTAITVATPGDRTRLGVRTRVRVRVVRS